MQSMSVSTTAFGTTTPLQTSLDTTFPADPDPAVRL